MMEFLLAFELFVWGFSSAYLSSFVEAYNPAFYDVLRLAGDETLSFS